MKLVTAASFIGALSYTQEAVAFLSPARPAFASASHHCMSENDCNESYQVNRRDALVRTLSTAVVLGNVGVAYAAEFSGSSAGDSDKEPSVAVEKEPEDPSPAASSKTSFSATAGGQTSPLTPSSSGSYTTQTFTYTGIDPEGVAFAGATILGAVYAVGVYRDDTGGTAADNGPSTPPPPAVPYGLDAGRNYYKGVELQKPPAPPKPAAPKPVPEPIFEEPQEEKELPPWALKLPTPYGIANRGKNPFIKPVEEYCEKGKVDENCTDSIKSFVDNVESTGTKVTTEEAETIVQYLESLSEAASDAVSSFATEGKSTTKAGFANYLDGLKSESSNRPGATSANAVMSYLDTLNGAASLQFSTPPPIPVSASLDEPLEVDEPEPVIETVEMDEPEQATEEVAIVNESHAETEATVLPSGATVKVSVDTTVQSTGRGTKSFADSMTSSTSTAGPPSGKGIGNYLDSMNTGSVVGGDFFSRRR
ncbi:hypothetical protein ACHAXS_012969 [Conticribra weissflogii]